MKQTVLGVKKYPEKLFWFGSGFFCFALEGLAFRLEILAVYSYNLLLSEILSFSFEVKGLTDET